MCTLHNSSSMAACDACGTPRPAAATSNTRGRGRASAVDVENPVESETPKTTGAKATARPGLYRPAHARQHRNSRVGDSVGRPALATWTCRKCPFAFPNAAERATCESCGALREGVTGGGCGRGVTTAPKPKPWACGVCTVLNPGALLACGTCEATRGAASSQGACAAQRGECWQQGDVIDRNAGWMGDSGFSGGAVGSGSAAVAAAAAGRTEGQGTRDFDLDASTPCPNDDHRSGSGAALRVCGVCTLRNPAQAAVCAACGIPLAESEAAASEGVAVDDAAATMDDGELAMLWSTRSAHAGEEGGGSAASRGEPDLIDLS